MKQIAGCLLALLFWTSSPAIEGKAAFWQSSIAAKTGGELTGQIHHAISRPVHEALEAHPNLRGVYQACDPRFVTQAKDLPWHLGYPHWHRQLDAEVSTWIEENQSATPQEFESYLRQRYTLPDLRERFPEGL